MIGGLGSAASGLDASILFVLVVPSSETGVVIESYSANYLVKFVVNYMFDLPPTAMQFTTKFTK